MSDTISISEAVLNGIRSLTDETIGSSQSEGTLADQKRITALARGNDRAARYWEHVLTICRRLERRSA